jgi:hypothetical protein
MVCVAVCWNGDESQGDRGGLRPGLERVVPERENAIIGVLGTFYASCARAGRRTGSDLSELGGPILAQRDGN